MSATPDPKPKPKARVGRPPKGSPLKPVTGVSGLAVSAGNIREGRDMRFRGKAWRDEIGTMLRSDPIIGGVFLGIDLKIIKAARNLTAATLPNGQTPSAAFVKEAERIRDFTQTCFNDMNQPFPITLFQINTMLPYGWSYQEVGYKLRQGPLPREMVLSDGSRRQPPPSKYDDGLIGWHTWAHRHPDTLARWEFGKGGSLKGMWQRDPNDGKHYFLPIQRAMLFRPRYLKGNPEGISTLTNTWRPWYFKRQMEQLHAVGMEREMTGLLVLYVTENLLAADASDEEKAALEDYRQMLEDMRADPSTAAIFPSVYDAHGNQMVKVDIVESAGERQYNAMEAINYYDQRIAFTTLAQFMLLGSEKVGSFALSSTQAALFVDALNTWAGAIADVINEFGIRRLVEVNRWDPDMAPTFSFSRITDASLDELAGFLKTLSDAGMGLFPNYAITREILERAGLPTDDLPTREEMEQEAEEEKQFQQQQREMQLNPPQPANGQPGGQPGKTTVQPKTPTKAPRRPKTPGDK